MLLPISFAPEILNIFQDIRVITLHRHPNEIRCFILRLTLKKENVKYLKMSIKKL